MTDLEILVQRIVRDELSRHHELGGGASPGGLSDGGGSDSAGAGDGGGLAADPGGDFMAPNYLTIDPATGAVSASFSGNLNLVEGAANPPATASQIRWLDAAGGAKEAIFGYALGGPPATLHDLRLEAKTPGGGQSTSFQLQAASTSGDGVIDGGAGDDVNGQVGFRLYDSLRKSSFPQLGPVPGSTAYKRVCWGSTTATFPGGTSSVDAIATHNLGNQPDAALAICIQVFEPVCFCEWLTLASPNNNQIKFRIYSQTAAIIGAGTNKSIIWVAIG